MQSCHSNTEAGAVALKNSTRTNTKSFITAVLAMCYVPVRVTNCKTSVIAVSLQALTLGWTHGSSGGRSEGMAG